LYNEPPLLLEISEQEYADLRTASESLSEILFIEEKFDIILENTLELEVEMLRSTEKFVMFSDVTHTLEKLILNRRVVNLLTACRLYLDHTAHHLSRLLGKDSEELKALKKTTSEQYDNHFGYRFMEAMRNFVQHRGYPISEVSYSGAQTDRHETHQPVDHNPTRRKPVRYDITPIVSVAELKKDGAFKTAILREIEQMNPAMVNLKLAIRDYVECISRIHGATRKYLEDKISVWENTLNAAALRIEKASGSPVEEEQVAVVYDDQGLPVDSIDIPGDVVQDRKLFYEKNALFRQAAGELSRTFVTSEAVMDSTDVEVTVLDYIDLALRQAVKIPKIP
jgi:hypothetical protein